MFNIAAGEYLSGLSFQCDTSMMGLLRLICQVICMLTAIKTIAKF